MKSRILGALILFAMNAQAAPVRFEAENALIAVGSGTGEANVVRTADPVGFSGTGYVGNFERSTDMLTFSVSPGAGEYELRIGFSSPTGAKTVNLKVNTATTKFQMPSTPVGQWSNLLVGRFQLAAGTNTIAISPDWTWFKIDYIELELASAELCQVGVKCEAEKAGLLGPTIGSSIPGYSGTGYAAGFTAAGHQVEFPVQADVAGRYAVEIGYACEWGAKSANLDVNGASKAIALDSTGQAWKVRARDTVSLLAGQNSVVISTNWTYFNIDYIKITPGAPGTAMTKPPKGLSDPLATTRAKALQAWFVDHYGTTTLSGQQNIDEVNRITTIAGERPAILAGDYMEFSPSRHGVGMVTRPVGYTEQFIDSAEAGYLITMMWHWNAPTDLVNQKPWAGCSDNDGMWYRGFYTCATTFDLGAVLADTNGAKYKTLISDMDSIALELKKFSDANVPVLWRPLHEAEGTWFWWGAKGADNFKKLWRIMYKRYTQVHGLHNLIWVYTSGGNQAWYPGDDVVDMVGTDAYPSSVADPLTGIWGDLLAVHNGKKLLTLSEFGGVPDIAKMQSFGVWWSYFVSWSGSCCGPQKMTDSELDRIYSQTEISNRADITLASIWATPLGTLVQRRGQPLYRQPSGARFDLLGRSLRN